MSATKFKIKGLKMIFIDREIVTGLKEEVKIKYVMERVEEYVESLDFEASEIIEDKIEEVSEAISSIIRRNEDIIEKYGMENYYKETYPAFDYESGIRSVGRIIIVPFDWSVDSQLNFDYTFILSLTL
jgi:hypothetical protein